MSQQAKLYRMQTEGHICPFGLKSKDLLKRKGFDVEDHPLTSREQTDAFKAEYGVETTPQTFIEGKRIGGYDDLKKHFGMADEGSSDGTSYQPVIAVFATTFLMALAVAWQTTFNPITIAEQFIAISMCVLGILKLRDLNSFSNTFITYDLIGMRAVRYAYVYPFIEMLAGVAMIAGVLVLVAAPLALFVGAVGAVSVFKAVYIDKRELKCACVGGDSNVPLGLISLTENVMMVLMAVWMLFNQL